MRKKLSALLILLLALCLLSAVPASADGADSGLETLDYYVSDAAGLLTRDQWQKLEDAARSVSEQYDCGVYVITINDYRDYIFSSADACA